MNLRKKTLLVSMASVIFLAGCGGGSDSVSSPSQNTQTAINNALIENPDLATQIGAAPAEPSAQLSSRMAASPGDTPNKCPAFADKFISIADLQANYQTQFCQLDSSHGVTMQSPQCQANIQFIKQQSGTGNFDLEANPIVNNSAGVTGVTFKPVTYTTQVDLPQGQQTFNVSGGLLLPQVTGEKIRGVVTYFHATTFNKCIVGSNYDYNPETQLVAEVFASQGYIVVIPDYVGQGVDWQNVHPYVLYPKVSAKTAVDMLAAVAPIIQQQYGFSSSNKLNLFSAGYSEGGAYSLWFSSFLNDQPNLLNSLYSLKHSVGMEGAYQLSTVTKGYLFDNVSEVTPDTYNIQTQVLTNMVKPLLSADAFLSYATYEVDGDVGSVFNTSFYNLEIQCSSVVPPKLCNLVQGNKNMSQVFAQKDTNAAGPIFVSALGKSANQATYPSYLNILISSKNTVDSLVSPTLLSPAGQTMLDTALRAADVNLANLQDKAVSIISLDKDSVVTPNNYKNLLANYPTKILDAYWIPAQKIQVVSPVSYYIGKTPQYVNTDHMHALIYEFLYALNTFNKY